MKIKKAQASNGNTDVTLGKIVLHTVLLNDMQPAAYNPRTMGKDAKAGLSKSLSVFGLVQPIIWNKRTGNIVGGHQRYYELLERHVIDTDCVVVDLPLVREKALNVTLNNKYAQGDFISEDLSVLITELKTDINFMDLKLDKLISSEDAFAGIDPKPADDPDWKINEPKFLLMVHCDNEFDQKEKLDKIKNELGWNCTLKN